jgi:hypothetical protein
LKSRQSMRVTLALQIDAATLRSAFPLG